ncbi:MAG: low molecular weight phosphotyrosine protein phosphatase [Bacilli bacterium]|nr:low molecular weight phosphotyrosine protein phosphatase [Bacilli bacterium]
MKRICFVCLGNICRSPMAEFVMKDKVKKLGKEDEFIIESRATSYEEEGNDIYPPVKELLKEKKIPYTYHEAKRLEKEEEDNFDYFIGMDENNMKNIKRIISYGSKIKKLLSRDILDPWYTRDFEKAYQDIQEGINRLLEEILKK